MKRKLYTQSHDLKLLKEVNNNGGQFTSEEHAYVIQKEFGETVFNSKDSLLKFYLEKNFIKLPALVYLRNLIVSNKVSTILSLGAGQCVLEYLLKLMLPDEIKVIAADFNFFFIDKANQFFSNDISLYKFDFLLDDFNILRNEMNTNIDIVVFFGSAYVMDDDDFRKLFYSLKKSGVKQIVDFHAGYMDFKSMINYLIEPIIFNSTVRKIFNKTTKEDKYRGKFHGYSRSKRELRKLYKMSSWKILNEIKIGGYNYVALLG